MLDIRDAYVNIASDMLRSRGEENEIKYAKVKQAFYYDKKYGWIPFEMPEIEFFY